MFQSSEEKAQHNSPQCQQHTAQNYTTQYSTFKNHFLSRSKFLLNPSSFYNIVHCSHLHKICLSRSAERKHGSLTRSVVIITSHIPVLLHLK